jgi:hypothetical protein
MANTRLSGHALRLEGAAYLESGDRWIREDPNGPGAGRCSCGAVSGTLPSRAARKRWHFQHKEDQRASQ